MPSLMMRKFCMPGVGLRLGIAVYLCAFTQFVDCAEPSKSSANPVSISAATLSRVTAWRRDFHQYPELGNREVRTAKIVATHLRKLGLEVRENVAVTGVIAILKGAKPGKRLVLRADMDALPVNERNNLPFASKQVTEYRGEKIGVMHACGHDAHTAILMGVAENLVAQREQLYGEVMFVFQPAEESPPEGEEGGARLIIKQNVLQEFKPDAIVGMHVWAGLHVGEIGYRSGPTMASSDAWSLKITGKQTHGSMPWSGVDPIMTSAQIINSYQTIISRETDISHAPAVLSVGAIKGGIRFNIIPETVELLGTLRTFDANARTEIIQAMNHHAEHIAAVSGARTEFDIQNNATMLVNNPSLSNQLVESLKAEMGQAHVSEMDYVMAAEDFADFSSIAPLFYFFVGSTDKKLDLKTAPRNHSPDFILDEGALEIGLRNLTRIAQDYLKSR